MKLKTIMTGAAFAVSASIAATAFAAETIKVGVLHSLSGTMAISESTLKDTVLMMTDSQWSTNTCLVSCVRVCVCYSVSSSFLGAHMIYT